jgi:type VI secretion system secreted protein VgrG
MPRVMELTTPLGPDVLLFHVMHAREELGRLSECHFDLLSEDGAIKPDDILGKNVTLRVELPSGDGRFFNGYVTRFSQGGKYGRYHRYFAVVRPWLWFLTRTTDCKIFQEMTAPAIIKKVFEDHPTHVFELDLTNSYRPWTYCVQYRETDFNFVSRLMEHEGMYYYFRHEDGRHTLVLTDSMGKHSKAPGYETLPFLTERLARPDDEHVSSWDFTREIQPGVYVHDDYDMERPSVKLRTNRKLPRTYTPSDYEIYDYPGYYTQAGDGTHYASARIDEYGTQFETSHAQTNARGVSTGCCFTLDGCPRDDQNRDHLITGAAYDLEFSDYEAMPQRGGATYRCSFAAMSTEQQFRPKRTTPKPFVQGPQTAVVVGPAGDEIYTDKYGRVKVQFHWDRYGEKNENSSCWIRVSHPWAGKAWGGISLPRIGQEVIVDFLEGDPDQPIITGRVYNAEQMPPYALPANMTQSGIKSRSSKGGGPDNFNEIRFEDMKGSEQLFIHAEKNQDIEVENDETHWVGRDRKKTIDRDEAVLVKRDRVENVKHDETIEIGHDRSLTVLNDKSEMVTRNKSIVVGASHSESIGASMSLTVGSTLTETVAVNHAEMVGGAMELTVGGALAITVGAAMAESVGGAKVESIGAAKSENIGGNRSLNVGGNATDNISKDRVVSVTKDEKVTIGGQNKVSVTKEYILNAKKIQLVGEDEIHIKCGSAELLLKSNGDITMKGNKINVKGSGDVIVKGSKIAEN